MRRAEMGPNPNEQTQTRFTSVIRDRRRFPRVQIDRGAQVLLANGALVPITVHDVSPDGLQIRCSRRSAFAIHPSARSITTPEEGPEIVVILTLPEAGGATPVKFLGQLTYFALINTRLVAMGVEFRSMSVSSRKFLDAFICASLEPAD